MRKNNIEGNFFYYRTNGDPKIPNNLYRILDTLGVFSGGVVAQSAKEESREFVPNDFLWGDIEGLGSTLAEVRENTILNLDGKPLLKGAKNKILKVTQIFLNEILDNPKLCNSAEFLQLLQPLMDAEEWESFKRNARYKKLLSSPDSVHYSS